MSAQTHRRFPVRTLSIQNIAKALGGEAKGDHVRAPGPGHSAEDRSLSVKVDATAPDGFLVHSFAGDDEIACKDHVRAKLGLPKFTAKGRSGRVFISVDAGVILPRSAVSKIPS
jgi:hypothetical protein